MEPIRIQALVVPSSEVPGDFVSYTTYDLCGQGGSLKEAKDSARSVVINHLDMYARQSQPLPRPEVQLDSLEAVVTHFNKKIPSGAKIVKEKVEEYLQTGIKLPHLIFEFYRVQ